MKKKYIFTSFLTLSLINLAIFFYRDNFIYHKKASHSSLYSTDTLKWKQFVYDYPESELKEAKRILDDSIKIQATTTAKQVLEIGRLLYTRFNQQSGRPSDILLSSSPLKQYQMLCSSDTQKIWCGVYANMFAFFCWAKGIPCRVIETINSNDHHVINECYLSESSQWAMVDLTFNRLLIFHRDERRYCNFFDFLNPLKENLLSMQAEKDSIITTQFEPSSYDYYLSGKPAIFYYYRVNNFAVYKPIEKFKRYLLPVAWHEEVRPPGSNFRFYLKESFLLLWLVSTFVLVIQFVRLK
jgi:hypothetical protein